MIKLADPMPDLASMFRVSLSAPAATRDGVAAAERPSRRRRRDASIAELKTELPHFNQVHEHIQMNSQSVDTVIYS